MNCLNNIDGDITNATRAQSFDIARGKHHKKELDIHMPDVSEEFGPSARLRDPGEL